MTDRIEPALTPEEWRISSAALRPQFAIQELQGLYDSNGDAQPLDVADMPRVIALANAALPDSDPRKITRHQLFCLREVLANFSAALAVGDFGDFLKPGLEEYASQAETLAAALESYLPPE